jgi:NAD+ synthase
MKKKKTKSKNLEIVVFGSAFNPPHFGHYQLLKKAFKIFKFEKIVLMPTFNPPLKKKDLAPVIDRLNMAKLFSKLDKRFVVSEMEIKRKGKSYTLKTIRDLKKEHPKAKIYWLIGEDSLKEIVEGKWYGGLKVLDEATFIVFTRKGSKYKLKKEIAKKIKMVNLNVPISGKEIRKKIKKGEDVKNLVPKIILDYIKKRGLYGFMKTCIDFEKIPSHLKIKEIEAKEIIRNKIKEIKEYFRKSGFKKGIIGLSGGLDSAFSAFLVSKALGAKNLIIVRMPYFKITDKKDLKIVEKLARNLKIPKKNILTVPINKPVDASFKLLRKYKGGDIKIRKGNLMARERMKILFDLSQVFKAIVVGTENRSEKELGYFTLWGDQASGIEPILNLWKTQIYQIAYFIKEIPSEILNKAPSPVLWKNQSAEKELGFNTLEADIVLSSFKDLKMSKREIAKKFGLSLKKINKILNRAKIGEIKAKLPYILKN